MAEKDLCFLGVTPIPSIFLASCDSHHPIESVVAKLDFRAAIIEKRLVALFVLTVLAHSSPSYLT